MTEKRFTLEMEYWKGMPQGRKLFDNLIGQEGMSVEELCDIASALHCKCEKLESINEVYENSLNKLEDENEQLKQFIYDNLDEDICDVCSYQYLEKSQMDKYYVAKCKKGYDNCSKGTVIHCKDFKFKELSE